MWKMGTWLMTHEERWGAWDFQLLGPQLTRFPWSNSTDCVAKLAELPTFPGLTWLARRPPLAGLLSWCWWRLLILEVQRGTWDVNVEHLGKKHGVTIEQLGFDQNMRIWLGHCGTGISSNRWIWHAFIPATWGGVWNRRWRFLLFDIGLG